MKKPVRLLFILLLGSVLLASGYAYHQAEEQQAATLAQLADLEMRLAKHNQQTDAGMATTVRAINYYTHLNASQPYDLAVLAASQLIVQRTQSLADTLRDLQHQIRLASGESPRSGSNSGIKASTAARLGKQLVSYAEVTYGTAKPLLATLQSFAGDGQLAAVFSHRQPLPVTLAGLNRLETQVWRTGAKALGYVAEKSGRTVDWYDPIQAFAAPESETVTPGQLYRARLFLRDNNLHYYYTSVSANGKALAPALVEGSLLTLRVSAQSAGRASGRAHWRGTIHALAYPEAHPYAADSVWQLTVPYFINNPPTP
ncbi:hypothetical protein [Hymenobacter armeniacus]|uniref:Gliding motility-associated protein GldM N-terminal domain-containing protein n=1 Tax=Hymenobacter armeniacus TaxID=2771358 RepID=A0ABR8JR28_9BACT|nr:hypothetical protein [Hymenobacter armeniacus]MBD2721233.1 hypothetical protein [Hymenobacter armeniacus]